MGACIVAKDFLSLQPGAVLCGAGISMEPPASLPSGEALALTVVELLLDSDEVLSPERVAPPIKRVASSLRLELLLEVMSQHISLSRLVAVYTCMQDAVPNHNHFALVQLKGTRLLTTNQDVLLERSAALLGTPTSIIHLHGVCSRPRTVVTAISQYMAGLPDQRLRELRKAVEDKTVMVVGYSGRDRDVMRALHDAKPRAVIWIRHPGSDLSPELGELREALGSRLTCITEESGGLLLKLLPRDSVRRIQREVAALESAPWSIPPAVRDVYRQITPGQRNGAIAELLRHVGEYELVVSLYEAVPAELDSPRMKLALASAHRHLERYAVALRLYREVARGSEVGAYERCQALLGEIESLRRASRVSEAKRLLVEVRKLSASVRDLRQRSHVRAIASVIDAGILRAAGCLPVAIKRYEEALEHCDACRDLETHLEAQLWYADVLRAAGRFLEARQQLTEIAEESGLYTRKYTKGWVPFVTADVCLAMGDLASASRALNSALDIFQTTKNEQGQAWVGLLLAVLSRLRGRRSDAGKQLRMVAETVRRGGTPLAFVTARLELERAELARISGEETTMRCCLERAASLADKAKHFGQRPEYLRLHCKLVELEWARQSGGSDVSKPLYKLAADYEDLGFYGCAARAQVAAWLAAGDEKPPPRLVSDCRRHGRDWELAQLEGRRPSTYPILFA